MTVSCIFTHKHWNTIFILYTAPITNFTCVNVCQSFNVDFVTLPVLMFQLFISLCVRHNKLVCQNLGVVEHLFGLSQIQSFSLASSEQLHLFSRLLTVWDMQVYIRTFSDQVDAGWGKHDWGHLDFHDNDLYRKKTSDILKYEIVNVYRTRRASLNFEQL